MVHIKKIFKKENIRCLLMEEDNAIYEVISPKRLNHNLLMLLDPTTYQFTGSTENKGIC